jgi:protein-tyrosine phosphatase
MPTRTWWIDEPRVMASSNPSDEDLARLRAEGFGAAVSFLEESKHPPRYDGRFAAAAGWTICSIPIEEGCAPSLEQISEFTERMKAVPDGTKVLVFCESGSGRSALMGAVY